MNAIYSIRRSQLVRLFAVALVLISTAGAYAITTPNLLVDPSFENPGLTPFTQILGPPFATGVWGGENAANVTGPVSGVFPAAGLRMHQMDDDGLSTTQSWQLVNVSAYSAAINANTATVNFGALFNVPQDIQNAVGSVGISFFNGGQVPVGPPFVGVPANPDSNPASWQPFGQTGVPVPPTTQFIRMQLAYSNVTMQSSLGPDRPGFVDNARLTLTIVPEPSTGVLAIGGLAGVLCSMRRKRRDRR